MTNATLDFQSIWPMPVGFNQSSDDNGGFSSSGGLQKVFAMAILGVGSFLSGMLPAIISERNRQRFPLTTSLMLCFGAGILLATALIHILPEVRKQLDSNWAEISLCGGFFAIYFIDEFIHYFFGEALQRSHSHGTSTEPNNSQISRNNYGTLHANESEPLLNEQQHYYNSANNNHHQHSHNGGSRINEQQCPTSSDETIEDANVSTTTSERCTNPTGTFGLFVALSLHSAIEGIAIGVQNSATKVLFLLGAVACHKFVMGFCLGLEFRSNPQTKIKSQIIGISVFALGAVCGIGLGMLLVDIPNSLSTTALPVIQGLAGGTLFYVTTSEVIPREKAKWHQNSTRKSAGLSQFLVLIIGFTTMAVINFYLDDDS